MVMNEENRKKILIGSIIAVITLVIVVAGATYAFFSLNVSGDTTNTNVDIETGNADVVTIEQGAENIHINLAVSDMAKDNPNKAYYATDTDDNYKLTVKDGTLTFATITGTNKEASDCTAKVTITMDTSNDSMGKVLKNNDAILHLESGEYKEDINLASLLTEEAQSSVTKEIEVDLSVSESAGASITGYLKVNNTDSDQSYLAGKTLNITISISNLDCEIRTIHPNVKLLQEKGGDTFKEQNGMYRFVDVIHFADNVVTILPTNNYICFGTENTETCKATPENYMYRIIGITSERDNTIGLKANQLKLIKAIPSTEKQKWNSLYAKADCETDGVENDKCKWDASDMKTYLNTTFLPDAVRKWENGEHWQSLITSQKWYNAIQSNSSFLKKEEKGDPVTVTEACQIGLMYASDYNNGLQGISNRNWLYITNGWEGNPDVGEWTMSRRGLWGSYYAVSYPSPPAGQITHKSISWTFAVRPVFYVDPNVTLTGEGSTDDPFIIHSS